MTNFLGILSLLAVAGLICGYGYECRKHGHEKGYNDGYKEGRREADHWWLQMEQHVRETQKELWRGQP